MAPSELVAWFRSSFSHQEFNRILGSCEWSSMIQSGHPHSTLEWIQIIQMRAAEEFRALDRIDLAIAMTSWVMRSDLTRYLIAEFGEVEELPQGIPEILDFFASELVEVQSRLVLLDSKGKGRDVRTKAAKPHGSNWLSALKVGDPVVRWIGGSIPVTLTVTNRSEFLIECGLWVFDAKTGAEIDEDLDLGPGVTISILRPAD